MEIKTIQKLCWNRNIKTESARLNINSKIVQNSFLKNVDEVVCTYLILDKDSVEIIIEQIEK